MKNKTSKENLKRQRLDNGRSLRVVKYLDFSAILPDSPVEVNDGYIVSDRNTYEVFASLVFKNVSNRNIRRLNIQLLCYLNQNIPYCKVDFSYSHDELTFGVINSTSGAPIKLRDSNLRETVARGECFGSHVYIPLPENYFTKLEVLICSVEYAFGETEDIGLVAGGSVKRYDDLDNISKMVYTRVNIYDKAESAYPTVVMPQESKSAWLCCCGFKNPIDAEICGKCGREKEWQMKSITLNALEETKQQLAADPTERTLHDKTRYRQDKYLETDREIEEKIAKYEKAMLNLAEMERLRRNKHKRNLRYIAAAVAVALIIWLIIYIVQGGGLVFFPYST